MLERLRFESFVNTQQFSWWVIHKSDISSHLGCGMPRHWTAGNLPLKRFLITEKSPKAYGARFETRCIVAFACGRVQTNDVHLTQASRAALTTRPKPWAPHHQHESNFLLNSHFFLQSESLGLIHLTVG